MSKYYLLGGLSIAGGALLLLWQAISSMMTAGEIVWEKLSLLQVVDAKYLEWADGISPAQYVINMPLYILLIAVGVLLFIVGGIVHK